MKTAVFSFIFVALFFSLRANAGVCELKPKHFEAFLKQDFWTFDQSDKGWRSLHQAEDLCHLAVSQLIDSYHLNYIDTLKPSEEGILYWHAGQNYAFLGLNEIALKRFSKSIDASEPAKPAFHWNAYVRATIAFLKKDLPAIQKAQADFLPVNPKEEKNFKIIERFIRCLNSSYIDAYTGTGSCK